MRVVNPDIRDPGTLGVKMSGGVEWAVHCCVVLSQADRPVPTARLAEFHGVSRTYLAKNLQQLSRAGLVRATEGRVGGYELTRGSGEITVLQIVMAIEGEDLPSSAPRCAREGHWRFRKRPAFGRAVLLASWRRPRTPGATRWHR